MTDTPMPNPIPEALKEAACVEWLKDNSMSDRQHIVYGGLSTIARLLWQNGWREPVDPDVEAVERIMRAAHARLQEKLHSNPMAPALPAPLPFTKTSANWKGNAMTDDLVRQLQEASEDYARLGDGENALLCQGAMARIEAQDKLIAALRAGLENILERGYISECIEEERPDYLMARDLIASIKEPGT